VQPVGKLSRQDSLDVQSESLEIFIRGKLAWRAESARGFFIPRVHAKPTEGFSYNAISHHSKFYVSRKGSNHALFPTRVKEGEN